MIEIVYDRPKLTVTVKGHAGSGEAGHDLVCAAASMLVYTLAANVRTMADDHARVRRPKIMLADGDALISCSPVHGMSAVMTLVFDSVCAGFELLAQQKPDNVSYERRG